MSASPARLTFSSSEDRRVVSFPHCPTVERINAGRTLSEAQRLDLERLRWLALRAQLAPRADLERACYVLAGQPAASLDRLATVFFRGLSERASSEMVIYRPGAAAVSDDECWLLRLVSACREGQIAAAGALVSWRVAPSARRWMRFLSAAMVRALDAA